MAANEATTTTTVAVAAAASNSSETLNRTALRTASTSSNQSANQLTDDEVNHLVQVMQRAKVSFLEIVERICNDILDCLIEA